MAEAEGMDVDPPALPSTSSGSAKKRFEVKKVRTFCHHLYLFQATFKGSTRANSLFFAFLQWNAVALWAWGKPEFLQNVAWVLAV